MGMTRSAWRRLRRDRKWMRSRSRKLAISGRKKWERFKKDPVKMKAISRTQSQCRKSLSCEIKEKIRKALRKAIRKRYQKDPENIIRAARMGSKAYVRRFRQDSEFAKGQLMALFSGVKKVSKPQLSLFRSLCRRGFRGLRLEYPEPPRSIDIAFPRKRPKVAIEVDGRYWHSSREDRKRDSFLKKLGWRILHVPAESWRDFKVWERI